jgi:hypothetical protein
VNQTSWPDGIGEPGKKLGRPNVGRKVEEGIRQQLGANNGILKAAKIVAAAAGRFSSFCDDGARQTMIEQMQNSTPWL